MIGTGNGCWSTTTGLALALALLAAPACDGADGPAGTKLFATACCICCGWTAGFLQCSSSSSVVSSAGFSCLERLMWPLPPPRARDRERDPDPAIDAAACTNLAPTSSDKAAANEPHRSLVTGHWTLDKLDMLKWQSCSKRTTLVIGQRSLVHKPTCFSTSANTRSAANLLFSLCSPRQRLLQLQLTTANTLTTGACGRSFTTDGRFARCCTFPWCLQIRDANKASSRNQKRHPALLADVSPDPKPPAFGQAFSLQPSSVSRRPH